VFIFFIPAKINFAKIIYIKTSVSSANRFISDESKWQKWWPDTVQNSSDVTSHSYKNYNYTINKKMYEGMDVIIKKDDKTINSFLHLVALNNDTVAIEWQGNISETNNPFKRIKNYLDATAAKNNISEILQDAKIFLENKEKVYGLNIIQEKVKDTILIATRSVSKTYPETAVIYDLIKELKNYIEKNGAAETNYPMLNLTQDSGFFRTMVAIPVNKIVSGNNIFLLKKMVPGKILVTEVKGGIYATREALRQVEIYMNDNHRQSPAIPFQSLVTDRSKESDTTKWITKIYYPVF
jgi:hypothetical protein